jgi:hypothetical protein
LCNDKMPTESLSPTASSTRPFLRILGPISRPQ